jgi:hypothetical protein
MRQWNENGSARRLMVTVKGRVIGFVCELADFCWS